MQIIPAFVTQNPLYQQYTRIPVRKLVLHSVGCPQPSAAVFARQWQTGAVFCARRAASGRHGVSGCAVGLPTDARRRCERIQHRRGNDRAGLHPVYQWRDICMLRPGACARAGDRHV